MPLGIQRLNAKRQPPNPSITFLKPLPGPTEAFAQDFLERVAAICRPIMAAHHLSITTLEEHEPNPEFIGRNFNAGEVVQLVLKAPYTGHWLSFRSVVMVMMHELAHCAQMNHSAAFWKVRNEYAAEMRGLWAKGYTGDGFWSRGVTLLSGRYEPLGGGEQEVLPERLCGGTFRSVGRGKRKRKKGEEEKPRLSYAERQQRRIARKFGRNGVALGEDEDVRVKLEDGKRPKGKPRVAGSARGRELRAAAALARFGERVKEEEEESGTDSEDDGYEDADVGNGEEARDGNGEKLLDGKGRGMVKVCEDEGADDAHVKSEMQELQDLDAIPLASAEDLTNLKKETLPENGHAPPRAPPNYASNPKPPKPPSSSPKRPTFPPPTSKNQKPPSAKETAHSPPKPSLQAIQPPPLTNNAKPPRALPVPCPICSLSNAPSSHLCAACSHVLDARLDPRGWKCAAPACEGSGYLNAGDAGVCGVCGVRRGCPSRLASYC